MNKVPMRQWASPSWDPKSGRAASKFGPDGHAFSVEGCRTNPSAQISAANGKGVNGAPGVSAMNKSGSGDPGRNRMNRD